MRREKEQMVSEESENERKDMPPPSWVGWCGTKSTVNDEPTRVSFAERFTTRAAAAWEDGGAAMFYRLLPREIIEHKLGQ